MLTFTRGAGLVAFALSLITFDPGRSLSIGIRRGGAAAAVFSLLALTACTAESHGEGVEGGSFYDGRVLEVIVPFGPGGGTDIWARILVPHLQSRIGHRAAIQVVNIPGASSLAGANDFALRRRPNGETALVSAASTFLATMWGEPMARYDFGDFAPIIGSPFGGVVYISPSVGVRDIHDLSSLQSPLMYGGISAAGLDLVPLLAFDLLGLSVNPILGYTDRAAARLAFEQGETDIDYQTIPAYFRNVIPLQETGVAVPLFSFGITDHNGHVIRDPAVPDLPSVAEVYEELNGEWPSGVEWDAYRAILAAGVTTAKVLWLHADAPEASIEALRSAAAEMASDPDFIEAMRAEVGDYPFYVGEEITRAFAAARDMDPEVRAWLHRLLRDRFELSRLPSPG